MSTPGSKTDQPDVGGAEYQCSVCEASYDSEVLSRIHITRSTDDPHKNLNGMMPETVVNEVNASGDIVEDIDGRTSYDFNLAELSPGEFPDEYTERERVVLMVAAQNPYEHTYSEIANMARDEAIRRDIDPLPYNRARVTIKQYYEPQTMSQTDGQTPDGISLADLTTKQQGIIIGKLKYPDVSEGDLASRIGLSYSYFRRICGNYEELLDDLQDDLGSNSTLADLLKQELSSTAINELQQGGYLDAYGVNIDEGEQQRRVETDETLADLTTRQQAIVIAKLVHPNVNNHTIAARVGTAESYPKQVFERANDIMESMLGEVTSGRDVEDVIIDQLDAESAESLTEEGFLDDVNIDLTAAVKERAKEQEEQVFDMPVTAQDGVMSASPQTRWDDADQVTTLGTETDSATESVPESEAVAEAAGTDSTTEDEAAPTPSETKESEAKPDTEEQTVPADAVPREHVEAVKDKVTFYRKATNPNSESAPAQQACHALAKEIENELEKIVE